MFNLALVSSIYIIAWEESTCRTTYKTLQVFENLLSLASSCVVQKFKFNGCQYLSSKFSFDLTWNKEPNL